MDAYAPLVVEASQLDDNDVEHGDLEHGEAGLCIVDADEVLAVMAHGKA